MNDSVSRAFIILQRVLWSTFVHASMHRDFYSYTIFVSYKIIVAYEIDQS